MIWKCSVTTQPASVSRPQIWRLLQLLAMRGDRHTTLDRVERQGIIGSQGAGGGCEMVVPRHTSLAANTGVSSCATPTVKGSESMSRPECGEGCGTT